MKSLREELQTMIENTTFNIVVPKARIADYIIELIERRIDKIIRENKESGGLVDKQVIMELYRLKELLK